MGVRHHARHADGEVLDGPWDVTPAVYIHTELHRVRPDATLIVHGHPYSATPLPASASRRRSATRTRASSTASSSRRRIRRGRRQRRCRRAPRRTDRQGIGILLANHGAIVPGRRSPRRLQGCHVRTDVPFHLRRAPAGTRLQPLPLGPQSARSLRKRTAHRSPRRRSGTARYRPVLRPSPTSRLTEFRSGHVARGSAAVGGVRRHAGPARRRHVPPRAGAARAVGDDRLGRRPRGRAARRVRRPLPGQVRRPGAPRRRHRRRRRGVALERRAAPQRRVQRGGRPARRASTASSPPASTRCAGARGTSQARLADMDINGVWASLCFPSFLPGLRRPAAHAVARRRGARASRRCGRTTTGTSRRGAARPPTGSSPTRSRGCATRRSPPRRSAATPSAASRPSRFSEAPEKLGLPSMHTGYWDPFLAACEETGTVVCLHVGSSGTVAHDRARRAAGDGRPCCSSRTACTPRSTGCTRRSRCASPTSRSACREGGIGWVAGLIDRLDHCFKYQLGYLPTWRDVELTPSEVLRRNFWFCAHRRRRRGCSTRHVIGVENILVESDYPHADSTWPDTQSTAASATSRGIPDDEVAPHVLAERRRAVPHAHPTGARP